MKRKILFIFIIMIHNGCTYINNQEIKKNNNIQESDYLKYKNSFFYIGTYENKTIKYFKGSYQENQNSSFEPMLPSGPLTVQKAKNFGTYYRVTYSNSNIVEGISISNGKPIIKVYYDKKGRKIKKYWYRDNSFEIISFNGEESLDRIYCNGKTKKCSKKHFTRKEDKATYGEPMPVFTFTP